MDVAGMAAGPALRNRSAWDAVEKLFGRKGTMQGGVFRIAFPRRDLEVHVGPIRVEPALALTSWVAFEGAAPHSLMTGDLVLLDTEVEPVTARLLASGVEVTGLHNHLLHETPRIMFLHIYGEGEPLALAERVKDALALTGTPPAEPPSVKALRDSRFDLVESIIGRRGNRSGNVLQFSIPRAEKITMSGREIRPAMGVAHGINFQMTGDAVAAAGDLVLLANEVNPVARALTDGGLAVTAVHNHMLAETPRLFFLHFWGVGEPARIAQGIKHALEQTGSVAT